MKEKWAIETIHNHLEQGGTIHQAFKEIGYRTLQVAQLNMAQVHGDFSGTLASIAKQIKDAERHRQLLLKVLSYPLLLLLFLITLLLGMRSFLLPQLSALSDQKNRQAFSILLIEKSPYILFVGMLLPVLFLAGGYLLLKRKTAIEKAVLVVRVPIVGNFYRDYLTTFFALEWGKLVQQGLEMKQILVLMSELEKQSLMQEMAKALQKELEAGQTLTGKLQSWTFLLTGLAGILEQGTVRGKLGLELVIYGEKNWELLLKKIEKTILWVQPILFLGVAILIVSIYAALLLPLYDGLEVIL